MPTETDLRNTLIAIADRAPAECDFFFLNRADTRHSRRRARWMLPITRTVIGVALPGYSTTMQITTAAAQTLVLESSDQSRRLVVTLYAPDGYRPPRPADAVDVEVNGAAGFYGTVQGDSAGLSEGLNGASGSEAGLPGALAWQYQPGAWAIVYGGIREKEPDQAVLSQDQAEVAADAVQLGAGTELRVPARIALASLPAGLQLQGLTVSYGMKGPSAMYRYGPSGTTRITLVIGVSPASLDPDLGNSVTVGPYSGDLIRPGSLELADGSTYLSLTSTSDDGSGPTVPDNGGGFSLDQLSAIVSGLTVADVADPASWYDAAIATS